MIIRLMVVDPNPRDPKDDVIIYQVPENSRAHQLLVEMLDEYGIDYVDIQPSQFKRKPKQHKRSIKK